MTIYVVTQGQYSDYGICGLFSTKEKAEAYAEGTDCPDQYTGPCHIEEWELDEKQNHRFGPVYSEQLYEDGYFHAYKHMEHRDQGWRGESHFFPDTHNPSSGTRMSATFARSSVSPEHAHKLCVEKRQEVLRESATSSPPCEPR